ncbi:MAG: amidohydrolase family protein [Anaeroplasma sp.]
MIIDFHTHIFPDNVAIKAVPLLEQKANVNAYTNGTLDDLLLKTKEAGIDYSLALPVVTSAKQTKSINDFAIMINSKNINVISFGGIHPDYQDYEEELVRLKNNNIKGIKLHPQYQNCFIDDERYIKIIDKAFELNLIVIIHAGIDIGIPGETMATPDRINKLSNSLKNKGVLVLAHMGSWKMWDSVYEKLLGKNYYIDTAFSLGDVMQGNELVELMNQEEIIKFINKHGSDKILFATDSPWAEQKKYINFIKNLNIDEAAKNNILGLNAKKLLNL